MKMMNKLLIRLSLVVFVVFLFTLNIYGAGADITKSYDYSGFTGLEVTSGMKLEVQQGDHYEVKVQAADYILEQLKVVQKGEILKFSLVTWININIPRPLILITMPELTQLKMGGGSIAGITMNVPDKSFISTISNGSALNGSLQAKQLELSALTGSSAKLSGQAEAMKVKVSSGSHVQLDQFQVENAGLKLSSGSTINVYATGILDVEASAGSVVYYRGNPRLGKASLSSGSTIKNRE